jgi:hypothetical protein
VAAALLVLLYGVRRHAAAVAGAARVESGKAVHARIVAYVDHEMRCARTHARACL